jgi:GTPase
MLKLCVATFLSKSVDASKFISGSMQALSAMVKLELPHINVLTKMDICPDKVQPAGCVQ